MKTYFRTMLVAAVCIGLMAVTSCKTDNAKPADNAVEQATDSIESTYLTAIDDYLVNEIGKDYSPADYSIPCVTVVAVDESNPDSILAWGDYWVFNYKLSGDTLLTESGGSHPGLMHIAKTAEGYKVTAFDVVADGTDNLESAKKIFGDKYDDFHAINSNEKKREETRINGIAEYVKAHGLSAKMVKDFGWDPINLPIDNNK
ncbi:MAG: hypothetical protein J5784_01080 [Muribaculaceae bacterium]|nr:hypothetical protein [Muribaculaceae bacterium]MBR5436873.1 hypothetical protein [Muribaculaceae bacterium]